MIIVDLLEVFGRLEDSWIAFRGVSSMADELCISLWRARGSWDIGKPRRARQEEAGNHGGICGFGHVSSVKTWAYTII